MPYQLDERLVVGIASSALFNLAESDAVFHARGEEGYRRYQEEHLAEPLEPGVAFPFIRRILKVNDLTEAEDPLVEVIVLSKNDPDTGLRVMHSIRHHNLGITRAIFMQGRSPYRYIPALNMSLFLSADETDVQKAVTLDLPAGRVMESTFVDDDDDELRIAFDFDGVLASDQSERVMRAGGLKEFREHEVANVVTPLPSGPLHGFLTNINKIQKLEEKRRLEDQHYRSRVRVSVVTARNAPAHERAVNSLKAWGVLVNDAFFLGGVDKGNVLSVLRPHIFFDDQVGHVRSANVVPSVHVPFGITNVPSADGDPAPRSQPVAGPGAA